jgi:hypothetical protein
MKLDPQFETFVGDIRPTASQREAYSIGVKTLRKRLMADSVLSPLIVTTFLQGSIRRGTALCQVNDKRPDVDLVVATTLDRTKVAPKDAIGKFIPFCEEHYKGKYELQGRSIGIDLSYVELDIVVTALPDDPERSPYTWQAVTAMDTLDEARDWRLVKSWLPERDRPAGQLKEALAKITADSDWKSEPLWIPDREVGTWHRTHPLRQIAWAQEKNGRCNGLFLGVVRATKWMRHMDNLMPKYPKGYPLEHLIGACCPDGIDSYAEGITKTLEAMVQNYAVYAQAKQTPILSDHGVPEHNVMKRVDAADFAKFLARITEAAKIAREALECTDAAKSGELWRKLFGGKFPEPPARGGDRGGGFTPRKEPSVAATAPRFA